MKDLGFKFDELKIIQNPLPIIMDTEGEWNIDNDVVRCSIKPTIMKTK